MTPVDLNDSIATTITVATNEWKYVADIVTSFDSDLPLVECMRDEINQVVLNLIPSTPPTRSTRSRWEARKGKER